MNSKKQAREMIDRRDVGGASKLKGFCLVAS